jgi:hypothetical protein
MISLPQGSYWKQTNESDRSGEIWASRNVTMDEAGVASLSLRSIGVFNSEANNATEGLLGDANLGGSWGGLVTPFATVTGGDIYVHTDNNDFVVDGSFEGTPVTEDTGAPSSSAHGGVAAWQGEVYVGGTSTVHSRTSAGTWTSRITGLTSGVARPLKVLNFVDNIAVGDGSTVKTYSAAHALQYTCSVPSNHETTCIESTNSELFFGTKNYKGKAMVARWGAAANSGPDDVYPIDATEVRSIRVFGGVPVITTNKGQVLAFNGAGFSPIANWPVFSSRLRLGQNSAVAGGLVEDGDILLASVDTETAEDFYLPDSPSGIHCYDPNVGLYHRYSFTGARRQQLAVSSGSVNTTTDLFTVASGTVPATGTPVVLETNTEPGGLKSGTVYYTINASSSTFKLASTRTLALAGTAIDVTSQGSGTHNFFFVPNSDFGQSLVDSPGSVIVLETPPRYPALGTTACFTLDAPSRNVTDSYDTINVLVDGPENRGHIVTSKIFSSNVTDTFNSVTVKARGLTKDIDKVVVKYRVEDASPLAYPVKFSTSSDCGTWASSSSFTVPDSFRDLSYVEVGDEVEFIQGAGSGYLAHVTAISLATGTWTVTIDEAIENIAASDTCRMVFTNFKKIGTMTSSDPGYKRFGIGKKGKFLQLKLEMRGNGVGIEQVEVQSGPDKKPF